MKLQHSGLRRYIQNRNLSSPHVLRNCDLVIDGYSFFKHTYRNSGCQFILGSDCDRYADFLKTKLHYFLENNIKCHVIYNGVTNHDLEKRKEIHQTVIDERKDTEQHLENPKYFPPLFITDVQKQVLEEMGIKYFVCEYDSMEAIVGVARKMKCPALTNNLEYSLFGVSCIPASSVHYDNVNKKLGCTIYEHDKVKTSFGVYNKMPILLTLLNERKDYHIDTNGDGESCVITHVIWLVKHHREGVLIGKIKNANSDTKILDTFTKIQTLYLYPSCNLAVKYFQRCRPHGLFKDDKKWFGKGVADGRIALPYIHLKKESMICGSSLMMDSPRPDALLAAIDIIAHSHRLLKNSQNSTITFVGRQLNYSSIWDISTNWDNEISNRDIFSKHRVRKKLNLFTEEFDLFHKFLEVILPGYNNNQPLERLPRDCWILIITLVYYIHKKNENFINGAYSILLSYLMLGPVSKKFDILKRDCQSAIVKGTFSNSNEDCVQFYNGLQFLFNRVNLKRKYTSEIVHSFSEFQHCLQHMNYLNKLCGENIPCTVYHDTYNATFVYNTYLLIKDKSNLMKFLENNFTGSEYLEMYKSIVSGFENCLSIVSVSDKKIFVNKISTD